MRRGFSVGFALLLMVLAGVERWGHAQGTVRDARGDGSALQAKSGGDPFPTPPIGPSPSPDPGVE